MLYVVDFTASYGAHLLVEDCRDGDVCWWTGAGVLKAGLSLVEPRT